MFGMSQATVCPWVTVTLIQGVACPPCPAKSGGTLGIGRLPPGLGADTPSSRRLPPLPLEAWVRFAGHDDMAHRRDRVVQGHGSNVWISVLLAVL